MYSYIILDNNKYHYEFTDSPYAFDEDLEYTLEQYCSIKEIKSNDFKALLLAIHSHVCDLRNNCIEKKILEKYELDQYGYGPQYENSEYYFLLDGEYILESMDEDYLFFRSKNKKISLVIHRDETDQLLKDESVNFIPDVIFTFDGYDVFVNEKKVSALLSKDLERLNSLFYEIGLEKNNISII